MAGEDARVEIQTCGEDDVFWIVAYVNGFECRGHIPVHSIEHGSVVANRLDSLVRDVYRTAYRAGFKNCQNVVKDALGVSR